MFRSAILVRCAFALMLTLATSAIAQSFPSPTADTKMSSSSGKQTAVLAGGCFWGQQAVFEHLKGVLSVTAGYSGGAAGVTTAEYEAVSSGTTGHAESVQITYDPSKVTYGEILKVFFAVAHDPTELNRQGPDQGTQYRSAIFYANEEQRRIAQSYINQLNSAKIFRELIVTEVTPLKGFFAAEKYHQDYAIHHPHDGYIVTFDAPKVANFKAQLPDLYVSHQLR